MAVNLTPAKRLQGNLPFALSRRTRKMFMCLGQKSCTFRFQQPSVWRWTRCLQRFLHKHIESLTYRLTYRWVKEIMTQQQLPTSLMMQNSSSWPSWTTFPSGEEKYTCYHDRLNWVLCANMIGEILYSYPPANSHDPAASGTSYWTSGFHFVISKCWCFLFNLFVRSK